MGLQDIPDYICHKKGCDAKRAIALARPKEIRLTCKSHLLWGLEEFEDRRMDVRIVLLYILADLYQDERAILELREEFS